MSAHGSNPKSCVGDITECSICREPFKTPKFLPCKHTFCMQCLENYGKSLEKLPGDEMHCPLCRENFKIPMGGIEKLKNNIFVEEFGDFVKGNLKFTPSSDARCDLGCETDATKFCVDCAQNICHACAEMHAKQRPTQLHKIVSLQGKEHSPMFLSTRSVYCDAHKSYELKLY